MVTLSCLIVLASLFAQLSSTLPDSAEPKAIEVLFFFYIAKLSYVFLCHTFLGVIQIFKESKKSQSKNGIEPIGNVIPFVPEKAFQYKSPEEEKKFSKDVRRTLVIIDRVGVYLGLVVELIFLGMFTFYIVYMRDQTLNQVHCP